MTNSFFPVDFCSLLMVMIILSNVKKINHFARSSFYFDWILRVLAAILASDIAIWFLLESGISGTREVAWAANILYFMLGAVFSYLWLRYVYCKLHDDRDMAVGAGIFAALPVILLLIVSLMAPFKNQLLNLDENGVYHRGAFFTVQYIIIFGYILVAAAWAIAKTREQCTNEQKQDYLHLARFAVLPFVGMVFSVLWPFAALSVLMVYIKFNNHEISIDALTGLNNRGTFNRYLGERCKAVEELKLGEGIFLTLIDINDFKKINDQFGHNVGDLALKKTAEVLKNVFGNTKAFISRYGGDEFAIVNVCKNISDIEGYLEKLNEQLEALYTIKAVPCKIQLSYGTERYGTYKTYSIEQLIEAADQKMYAKKIEMKKEQA